MFNSRLGFSGTPSDLLPLEFGRCHYENGSDGKMLHYLTSPLIVSFKRIDNQWNVSRYFLSRFASKFQSNKTVPCT